MNECYITDKVRKLLHVERRGYEIESERKIDDIMDALHCEIQASSEQLERKILRMLSTHFNSPLS